MSQNVAAGTLPAAPVDRGGGMLIRATLAQNVGTGCAFGGMGVSVLSFQDRFDAPLGVATMALSLIVLSMTALGPLIGGLIGRWGLRAVMSTGVLISLVGYVALAYAPSMPLALAACGLLIGPGAALFAALPPAILAGGWYPHARGRVMGIAYLPLFVTFLPLLGVGIIQRFGLTNFYLFLALLHLLLMPLVLSVVEPPPEAPVAHHTPTHEAVSASQRVLLGGVFWLIMVGDGILNGTAIAGSAHTLPVVTEYGISIETGAVLLAISGGASILGSLLAGYACDRVGAARSLGFASLGFAIAWALIAMGGWLPTLTVSAVLVGLCGAAVFPPISALVIQIYGIESLARVLGLLGIMTLPFTFAMSPVAGWLHDLSGSYKVVCIGLIALCMSAAAIFFGVSRRHGRVMMIAPAHSGAALPPSRAAE